MKLFNCSVNEDKDWDNIFSKIQKRMKYDEQIHTIEFGFALEKGGF